MGKQWVAVSYDAGVFGPFNSYSDASEWSDKNHPKDDPHDDFGFWVTHVRAPKDEGEHG